MEKGLHKILIKQLSAFARREPKLENLDSSYQWELTEKEKKIGKPKKILEVAFLDTGLY